MEILNWVLAIPPVYGRNYQPKIFTDITVCAKQRGIIVYSLVMK
jgi:hypothetical protein